MMTEKDNSLDEQANKPHLGFLIAAAVSAAVVVAVYLYQDDIIDAGGPVAFSFLLGLLVIITMILVLLYRIPRLGNRLLGYDVVLTREAKKEKASLQYTGTFKVNSGLEEKRLNSRRKSARATRKKMAAVTRQMHADNAAKAEKSDE